MNIYTEDDTNSPLSYFWYSQDTETEEFFDAVKPIYCHFLTCSCYMNMMNIDKHKLLVEKFNSEL